MLSLVKSVESILGDALALPPLERQRLLRRLVESLDEDPEEPGAEDAWAELIARRIADLDAGRATVIDARDALAKARAEFRKQG